MNRRIIIIGIVSGILKAVTLIFPFYLLAPATYSDTWLTFTFSEILRKVAYLPDVLLTIGAGYAAARLGWAQRDARQMQTGLLAGTFAGMVAWLLIGSATAGMAGSAPLLTQGITSATLLQANVAIVWWEHLSFWVMVLQSALFGLVGGWLYQRHGAAPWGNAPENIHPSIWKALGLTIMLLATIQVDRTVKTFGSDAADIALLAGAGGVALPMPVYGYIAWPVGAAFSALIVAVLWNWQWIAAAWRDLDIRARRNAWSAAGFNVMLPLVVLVDIGQAAWSPYTRPLLLTGIIGFALVTLLGIYQTWRGVPAVNASRLAAPTAPEDADEAAAHEEALQTGRVPPSMKDWYDYVLIGWPLCASLVMLSMQSIIITFDIMGILGGAVDAPQASTSRDSLINDLFTTHIMGGIGVIVIPLVFALLFSFYSWLSNLVILPRQDEPPPSESGHKDTRE